MSKERIRVPEPKKLLAVETKKKYNCRKNVCRRLEKINGKSYISGLDCVTYLRTYFHTIYCGHDDFDLIFETSNKEWFFDRIHYKSTAEENFKSKISFC